MIWHQSDRISHKFFINTSTHNIPIRAKCFILLFTFMSSLSSPRISHCQRLHAVFPLFGTNRPLRIGFLKVPVQMERCGSVCWCFGLQSTQFLCCRGHGTPPPACGCQLSRQNQVADTLYPRLKGRMGTWGHVEGPRETGVHAFWSEVWVLLSAVLWG